MPHVFDTTVTDTTVTTILTNWWRDDWIEKSLVGAGKEKRFGKFGNWYKETDPPEGGDGWANRYDRCWNAYYLSGRVVIIVENSTAMQGWPERGGYTVWAINRPEGTLWRANCLDWQECQVEAKKWLKSLEG